jgi:hypothetical protein
MVLYGVDKRQLRAIAESHKSTPEASRQAPVGILTSEHRDAWTEVRSRLS